jgi:hypothetical protein
LNVGKSASLAAAVRGRPIALRAKACPGLDPGWINGSREESASKQKPGASILIQSESKLQGAMTSLRFVISLYVYCLSMISAQTRSAFVAKENRFPLFRIML